MTKCPAPLDLSLKILHPGNRDTDLIDYDQAFDLWYEVKQEISPALPTYADNFTRQDEILVLRHEQRPIATCCYRYVDLRRRCSLLDSYFDPAVWPESILTLLPELGDMVALGSHIFVHPDFRGERSGVSIRSIMCALALMRVQYTGLDLMLGVVRTDRGMDRVFRDNGSVTLARSNWHNLPVALIAVFPRNVPVIIDPLVTAAVQMAVDASSDDLRGYGGYGGIWAAGSKDHQGSK